MTLARHPCELISGDLVVIWWVRDSTRKTLAVVLGEELGYYEFLTAREWGRIRSAVTARERDMAPFRVSCSTLEGIIEGGGRIDIISSVKEAAG